MWTLRSLSVLVGIAVVCVAPVQRASAAPFFASEVVSYDPGATAIAGYTTPSAALDMPDGVTGEGVYPGVVSMFNPPWMTDEIVSIGEGGHLTLKFAQSVPVAPGPQVGVFTNVGLVDANYPNGVNTDPAQVFADKSALVEVSANGALWFSLGVVPLNIPTSYYLNAGPYDGAAPAVPQVADFAKPFVGSLSDFDGMTYAEALVLLDGSAGGTWLDLSAVGLGQVQYIRFSVADDGDELNDDHFEVFAAALVESGVAPEPATGALLGLGIGLAWLVNRRRRTA